MDLPELPQDYPRKTSTTKDSEFIATSKLKEYNKDKLKSKHFINKSKR